MSYVDCMVMAVPTDKKEEFTKFADSTNPFFKEMGAIRILYCWGDEVMPGQKTDFNKAVQAEENESIVFCIYEWNDKETRDKAHMKMREARASGGTGGNSGPPPFDGSRMIMGGFKPILEC